MPQANDQWVHGNSDGFGSVLFSIGCVKAAVSVLLSRNRTDFSGSKPL